MFYTFSKTEQDFLKSENGKQRRLHLYLTNSNNTVLYTGVTSNLGKRIKEHQTCKFSNSFTDRYNVFKLVYYEKFMSIKDAIYRENQIKAGSRKNKIELINRLNSEWKNLETEIR